MTDDQRYKLLYGPNKTPCCQLGKLLFCEIRGWVKVRRLSDGLIPWPQTIVKHSRAFILCADLVEAVKRESEIAVTHWWGVSPTTVWQWRKVLGIAATNEGTSQLRHDYFEEPWADEARCTAHGKAKDPIRCAKISAARRGKPRPAPVVQAVGDALRGTWLSDETRRKMSEAHRSRGTRPPKAGRPWTPEEDALLGTMPDEEVARRTNRTVVAVQCRRAMLDIDGFYRKRTRNSCVR